PCAPVAPPSRSRMRTSEPRQRTGFRLARRMRDGFHGPREQRLAPARPAAESHSAVASRVTLTGSARATRYRVPSTHTVQAPRPPDAVFRARRGAVISSGAPRPAFLTARPPPAPGRVGVPTTPDGTMSDSAPSPLSGRTVLVTGATSGIGYETARQLAER